MWEEYKQIMGWAIYLGVIFAPIIFLIAAIFGVDIPISEAVTPADSYGFYIGN